jgi:hypothetical protein
MTPAAKGAGSLRQQRQGIWEIRVAAGTDPVTGRVLQRSVSFHGTVEEAEAYRATSPVSTGGDELRLGLHRCSPSANCSNYGCWPTIPGDPLPGSATGLSLARSAADGDLADQRVVSLTPRQLRATFARWSAAGVTHSVIGGRFRALRGGI